MTEVAPGAPRKISPCTFKIRPSVLAVLGAGFFVADRLFKAAALVLPEPLGWTGWAEFTLFRNTGIAFSLPLAAAVFWPLAALALAAVFYALVRSAARRDWFVAAALALVAVGAVSNLIDRRLYGATIDYLLFFGISAVNLADLLIVAGVVLLLFCLRRKPA